jgi:hypothetical protein
MAKDSESRMNIARALAISAAVAATMTAAPAAADLSGTYTVQSQNVNGAYSSGTWTITPCGTGCVDIADSGAPDIAP